MSILHIKNNTIPDFTGTVTVFNSVGSTVTANATDLVRPSDWNSNHNIVFNMSGNTLGSSQVSGQDVILVGGNNITLSADTANSKMVISGPNTLVQSTQPVAYSAANGSANFSTITFANSNGVSFSTGTQGLFATVKTDYLTTAAQSSASNISALYAATNNTGGGTATLSGGVSFSNANAITFYTSAGNAIAASGGFDLSQNSSLYQATSAMSRYLVMTNSSQTYAGTNVTMTVYSTNISISAAAGGGGGAAISAGANSQSTGTVNFANSNGITFGLSNNGTMTASYNSTQFAGVGSAITNGVMTFNTAGLSLNLSQLAGTSTGFTGANLSASMTLNSAGLALSMSAAAPGGGGAINVSAGTTSGNLQTLQFANSNGVSWGLNGSTVTASVNAGGGAAATMSEWEPFPLGNNTSFSSYGQNTLYFVGIHPLQNITMSAIEMLVSLSSATSSISHVMNETISYGFYSKGTGASTSIYNSMVTSSMFIGASYSSNLSGTYNIGNGANSFSSSSAGTVLGSALSGQKILSLPMATSIAAGGDYIFGMAYSTASTGNTGALRMSVLAQTQLTNGSFGNMHTGGINVSNKSITNEPQAFIFSVTSGAWPATIARSDFSAISVIQPYIYLEG